MRSSSTKSGSAFPRNLEINVEKGENIMRKNSIKLAAAVLVLTLSASPAVLAGTRSRGEGGVVASITSVVKRALAKIGIVVLEDEVDRPVKPVPVTTT